MNLKIVIVCFLCTLSPLIYSNTFEASQEVILEKSLKKHVNYWLNEYSFKCQNNFPSKEDKEDKDKCDDGDSVIFSGLLCFSGEQIGCKAVKNSQSDNGQWYRSPRRKISKGGSSKANFSRDQMLGLMLYFVKTKDKNSAERWWKWVNRKSPRTVCSNNDNVCILVDKLSLSLIAHVFKYIGIKLDSDLQDILNQQNPVENWKTTKLVIAGAEPGYVSHNYIVTLMIHNFINTSKSEWKEYWLKQLLKKDDMDENPFFWYVGKKICKNGCSEIQLPSHSEIISKTLQRCPKIDSTISLRKQWSWERTNSNSPWLNSMGWDCVFLGNLLLRK